MPRASKYEQHRDGVLARIQLELQRHGRPPSVRSLAEEMHVGVATMHSYLSKMAEEGLIEWRSKSHRTLRCTPKGIQALFSPDDVPF